MPSPAAPPPDLDLSGLKGREARYAHGRYSDSRIPPKRTLAWYLDGAYLAQIVRLSRIEDGWSVLDVNTGNPMSGTTAAALQKAAPASRVIAIDRSPQLIRDAAENAGVLGVTSIDFRVGYEEALPFADESFDLAVDRLGFHHNQRPMTALQEIRRVLRPGGRFVLSEIVSPANVRAESWFNAIWAAHDAAAHHVKYYRQDEIDTFLARAGFVEKERVPWTLPMTVDELDWESVEDRDRTVRALTRGPASYRRLYGITGTGEELRVVLGMVLLAYVRPD